MKDKVLILLLIFVLLTGCSYIPDPIASPSPAPAQSQLPVQSPATVSSPSYGGSLNLSMRPPHTLNPLLNEDETVDVILKLMFEHIFVLNENQRPIPNLAESLVFSENGMTATLKLKRNIFWSDGQSVDAADLVFSIKTLKEADKNVIYKEAVSNISSCRQIDDYTAEIVLNKPAGGLGYMLLFPLIPEHYYNNRLSQDSAESMNPVGNGPYKFVSYTNVKNMQLTASNTNFRAKPYIQKINVLITSDVQTDYYAFEQNILDVIAGDVLDYGKYSPSTEVEYTEYGTNYYDFLGFNFKNALFEDKKIRQAIASCIDKNYIIESVYLGHAYNTNSVISPASWAYEENVIRTEYNKDTARSLLSQAGFRQNPDGLLERSLAGISFPFSLKLLVNDNNKERLVIANMIKSSLEELGAIVEIVACDFETYQSKIRKGEFDLFIGGFNFSVETDFMFAFHSSQIDTGYNYFAYRSELLDSYIISAQNAVTERDFETELSNIQKHIASELPCVSIAFRKKAVLSDGKVKGVKRPVLNNIFININDWFIS